MSAYTAEQIIQHIEAVWDEHYVFRSPPEQEIRAASDPSHGMTLVCIAADLRSAWSRLDKTQREALEARYYWDFSLTTMTEVFGYESPTEADEVVTNAIQSMIDHLGG